jgi:hypothetical protein
LSVCLFVCLLSIQDHARYQLGSLSHLLGHAVSGYEHLPAFPALQPDPAVRDAAVGLTSLHMRCLHDSIVCISECCQSEKEKEATVTFPHSLFSFVLFLCVLFLIMIRITEKENEKEERKCKLSSSSSRESREDCSFMW